MSGDDQPFKVPSWAGKPEAGLHLDVIKNGSVLQKLLIDEKPCYIFGRAKDLCDFPLPHQSCSRQHAALVYHKHLNRPFLIDLGSTHGTFVGTLRLEAHRPTQIQIDTVLSFGASTRTYTLRERPQTVTMVMGDDGREDGEGGTLLGLPELDTEVDDLTQYNTAHNRQISMIGITENEKVRKRKYRPHSVSFSDSEEIINPEDVDPSVGKFRNMVRTTILPSKRRMVDTVPPPLPPSSATLPHSVPRSPSAISPTSKTPPRTPTSPSSQVTTPTLGFSSSLIIKTITAAPPVQSPWSQQQQQQQPQQPVPLMPYSGGGGLYGNQDVSMATFFSDSEPKKKKYAKEAWPGKKPTSHLLL